ncbi:hypothetical protein [Vibrio sp. SCSIO 43136]|uniref:hypothetical protein n=1 Tax=Vibrio sp. SCSIO 43136 TaxID=2819101 RepID=UPI0020752541|nr:hypothetical protein [Vibrio sp. SCSIO 43136]USD67430.1 hypothetical protein J4N39_22650 [Vibrio sp. SCSIO 43136]
MIRLIAIALIAVGIFIGVKYSDEIKDIAESDTVEQLQEGAEKVADTVSDLAG